MQTFQYVRHDLKENLLDFLARRFPYQTKEKWFENITSNAVKVNHSPAVPSLVLETKDLISYERSRSDEPQVDTSFQVLFQDDWIIAVSKNGNIPISESGKFYRNTLLNVVKEQEGIPELYAVHRLDKETSGVIVIAKDPKVATLLGKQFLNGTPEKTYHAVLNGIFETTEVEVDQPIKKTDPLNSKIRIKQMVSPGGKASRTVFYPIESCENLTLCKIRTFTGRTHQIRCHAEHIGHPILGDKLYGQSDERFLALLNGEEKPVFEPFGLIDRQLLHASSLSLFHPISEEKIIFKADFMDEFSKYPFFMRCFGPGKIS
ncbi:MAG: RluA family pseudouridine synthase [Deltaproteobacteria bacterium]|nr:RluA family pseudouridine synthase [Deltaproteobacteria bacterium]